MKTPTLHLPPATVLQGAQLPSFPSTTERVSARNAHRIRGRQNKALRKRAVNWLSEGSLFAIYLFLLLNDLFLLSTSSLSPCVGCFAVNVFVDFVLPYVGSFAVCLLVLLILIWCFRVSFGRGCSHLVGCFRGGRVQFAFPVQFRVAEYTPSMLCCLASS